MRSRIKKKGGREVHSLTSITFWRCSFFHNFSQKIMFQGCFWNLIKNGSNQIFPFFQNFHGFFLICLPQMIKTSEKTNAELLKKDELHQRFVVDFFIVQPLFRYHLIHRFTSMFTSEKIHLQIIFVKLDKLRKKKLRIKLTW